MLLKKLNFILFYFYFKLVFLYVFKLFCYIDVKNNFLKIKKYYFNIFLKKLIAIILLNTIYKSCRACVTCGRNKSSK